MKVSVGASFSVKTYRPSRGAVADPFAPTDATVLAGASDLALPGTRLLTAGGERMESMLNNSLMEHFSQKHSVCPGTFLRTEVNVLL